MIVIQYHHFVLTIDAVMTLALGIKESLIMSHMLFLVCKISLDEAQIARLPYYS